jgi:hypothetical protein
MISQSFSPFLQRHISDNVIDNVVDKSCLIKRKESIDFVIAFDSPNNISIIELCRIFNLKKTKIRHGIVFVYKELNQLTSIVCIRKYVENLKCLSYKIYLETIDSRNKIIINQKLNSRNVQIDELKKISIYHSPSIVLITYGLSSKNIDKIIDLSENIKYKSMMDHDVFVEKASQDLNYSNILYYLMEIKCEKYELRIEYSNGFESIIDKFY